ncbi:phosphohydrolase [Bacterioplanes sanyensis]|uniref:Phosphohydrolase n=1 Tax=Bacterioplanes sanyensis TaxID=1249553 RepID=A0A222FJ52_9GAMM|nr:HD domain-containing protein [Bacterioplanes sanyensis]ASP38524.1 phosphohydrolase [Bacterioplanes sanyensis]
MNDIERVLEFVIAIEKLKDVQRKTRPVGLDRYENSAEHSWHACLTALLFKDYANEDIDIERVMKMLLIHDLGEIDAGDTIIYASETVENKQLEQQGVERLLALLSEEMRQPLLDLWVEFETGDSKDSQYARAIDRVPPLLHNLHGDGHSWKQHGISLEQVLAVNTRIGKGSDALWQVIRPKLEQAANDGLMTQEP